MSALEKAVDFAEKGSRYEDASRGKNPAAVRDDFSYRMAALALVSIAETFRFLARHWVWNACLKRLEDDPWPTKRTPHEFKSAGTPANGGSTGVCEVCDREPQDVIHLVGKTA